MNEYELVSPADSAMWQAYHDIRRTVLFEARGQFGVYDPNRPDDKLPGHHAKVLLLHGDPVGVVRIDVEETTGVLRRVAIRADVQRRGHGRALIVLAEQFALEQGCRRLASYVAVDAVGFYQKCGFTVDESGSDSLLMAKPIHRSA